MKNKSLARSRNIIPYIKDYRVLTGSVTATILIVQLDYWFEKYPDGFYKFLSIPENNPAYRDGDSWTEELGFSEDEFRTAFDKIGTRYKSKKEYNMSDDKFNGKYYCSYHDKIRGTTHYFRNHEVLDNLLDNLTLSDVRKKAKAISVNGEVQSTEQWKTNTEYTETTTENNSETTTNILTSHEVGKIVKQPSLTTKVKDLFNSYYEDMYHQKFVWDGNPLRCGKELKTILANAGNVDDDEKFSRIQSKMAVCRYLVETKAFKFNVFDLDKLANKWNEIVIPIDKDAEQCKHLLNVWNKLTGQEIAYTPAIAQMMTVAKNRNNLGMLQKAVCAKALNQFDIDNNSRNLATLLHDKSGQIATYAGKYDDQNMSGIVTKKLKETHDSNSPFPEISHTSNYKELIKYDWMQHGVDALAKYVIGQDGYRRLKDGEKIETLIEEIMAKKISEYSKQGLVKNG